MSKNKKLISFSFIIILILLGGLFYNLFTKGLLKSITGSNSTTTIEKIIPVAKVSTEGWKTCRNEEYGYEFKYPAAWTIFKMDENEFNPPMGGTKTTVCKSNWISVAKLDHVDVFDKTNSSFTINVVPRERFPDSLKNATSVDSMLSPNAIVLKEYIVGGERGLMLNRLQDTTTLTFMHNGAIFDVTYRNYNDIFDTILSTFKFLK